MLGWGWMGAMGASRGTRVLDPGDTDPALDQLRVKVTHSTWCSASETQHGGHSPEHDLDPGRALQMRRGLVLRSGWHKQSLGGGRLQSMSRGSENAG